MGTHAFLAFIRPSEKTNRRIKCRYSSQRQKSRAGYTSAQTAVKRSYGYDKTGNLTHSSDQRSGVTQFEYDQLGRITKANKETFAFDPAHNILSDGQTDKIADNRLKTYNGISLEDKTDFTWDGSHLYRIRLVQM
ncbi:RHS repeat domain-containing protein [Neisseria zalophi]|uniref:RHS repeat domain-containing protein n=1 Tax=Neisseria zalophi TaxID=640030 RepID=UPI001CD93FFF|nr:RHS repeat domain-containing protein [Neisseria zalophi]